MEPSEQCRAGRELSALGQRRVSQRMRQADGQQDMDDDHGESFHGRADCDSSSAAASAAPIEWRTASGREFNLFMQQQNRQQRATQAGAPGAELRTNQETRDELVTRTAPDARAEQRPAPSRHKRQSSYVSMHWLVPLAALCLARPAAAAGAPGTLVINIARAHNRTARSVGAGADSAHGRVQEVDALHYLQRYGYMNESLGANSNLIAEDSFHEAVTAFQRFAGIAETGSLDALTVRYMQMPRCGNKDLGRAAESGRRRRRRRRRRKRYALQGSKWRRQELSYRISQYPTRFAHKKHEVDSQIERAFRIWSQVAPIEFVVKKEGRVHIDIRFASGEHGDGDPFDGPGNTLAHAYFPQYGGDAHFDDQEYWTVDSYAGTNIFQVAAHELGHSLGLGHSSVREALMAPFYQKYKPNFRLHADDVLAIQALYGERDGDGAGSTPSSSGGGGGGSASTTEPAPPRRATEASRGADDEDDARAGPKPVDLCVDARIDAITRTEDGSTYVFRGQHYWQVKNEGLAQGPPGRIARDWDGLPGNLDAALTWSDGKTFFFKGDKYWRFFNKRREPGYPKPISVGFAGVPNNVDAAFVWSGNGKTYFFKRDKYWRFDSKQEPPVSSQYPKALKNWAGLPAGPIDAAFKWDNGMTYFFKGELYYRFDDRQFEVDSAARPAFPRSTAEWWFGCTNSNLPIRRRPGAGEPEPAQSEPALLYHRRANVPFDASNGTGARQPGGSISRSLLSSLGALFSSASSDSGASATSADLLADWSFHSGQAEEARRLGRRAESHSATRWTFPLLGASGQREQSLSAELRAEPGALSSLGPANATAAETN